MPHDNRPSAQSLKLIVIGAAYGLTAAAALVLNVGEAYRDEIWPRLIQDRNMPGVILALIGDRPVIANAMMGKGCPAAVCMRGEAIVAGMDLIGPFDRDQLLIRNRGEAAFGTAGGAGGIRLGGAFVIAAPERRP